MDKLKVTIYQRQRKMAITKELKQLIKEACRTSLIAEGREGDFEVTVTIVNNNQIREINYDTRGIDFATDVLSFPLSEDGYEFDINPITDCQMLGDIVISVERVVSQAEEFGHSPERELGFLLAHSVLHLCGFDHMEEEERTVMEEKQRQIMDTLKIYR